MQMKMSFIEDDCTNFAVTGLHAYIIGHSIFRVSPDNDFSNKSFHLIK